MKRLLPLLLAACAHAPTPPPMERVAVEGAHFVLKPSGRTFTPWGFNYDRDAKRRLLEDYWDQEWDVVAADFREMKALGASIVRIHLQFAKFMTSPDRPDEAALQRLRNLLALAEEVGLHLDLTGLGSYRRADSPAWYVDAPEKARWAMQARFWEAVASTCAASPAVAYYTLMNEPVSPSGPSAELWGGRWGRFEYAERLTRNPAGRDRHQITREWMDVLIAGIRKHDREHLVTAGTFFLPGGLTLGPNPKKVAEPLDFMAVHLYPKSGKIPETIELLRGLSVVGKPVVIQEMFALNCGLPEFKEFLDASRAHAAGWISFYWGRTADEYRKDRDRRGAALAAWLDFIKAQAP